MLILQVTDTKDADADADMEDAKLNTDAGSYY